MNNRNSFRAGLAGLAILASVSGCETFQTGKATVPNKERGIWTETKYQRTPTPLSSPTNVQDHELRRVTQKDTPHMLEGIIINEYPLYELVNQNPTADELGSLFVKRGDAIYSLDKTAGTANIESEYFYIPTRVTDSSGNSLHTLPLSTTGQFGIVAKTTQHETEGVQSGIFRINQEDKPYILRTITLRGKIGEDNLEFYTPRVEKEQMTNPNALPFYMLPVEGTTIRILESTGQIILTSDRGIYKPTLVSAGEYKTRKPADPLKLIAPEENPGAAASGPINLE